MTTHRRKAWEPPEYGRILAFIRITTYHPTSSDIGPAIGVYGHKLTTLLETMMQEGLIKRGGRGVSSRRNGGYFLPEETIQYNNTNQFAAEIAGER